jgi:hypothetical protein
MKVNTENINRAIKHTGLRVVGVRGAGCFYFVDAETDVAIDNSTVWIAYLNQLTIKQWIDEAEAVER